MKYDFKIICIKCNTSIKFNAKQCNDCAMKNHKCYEHMPLYELCSICSENKYLKFKLRLENNEMKEIRQIAIEQKIYMEETEFNETIETIWNDYYKICEKLGINPIKKQLSMMMHFTDFIKNQIDNKQETASCKHCINAKAKIAALPWNDEVDKVIENVGDVTNNE